MDIPYNDLSITSDMVFQYVFSSPGCEPGLLSFINAVQADAHRPLAREVVVKSPFNPQLFLGGKRSVLDIKAIDDNNRTYDIEMQTVNKDAFLNRILYYWSRLYCEQIQEGDSYTRLNAVVSIVLTRFVLFPKLPDIHNVFYITAEKNPEYILTDDLQIHTLELAPPKLAALGEIQEPLRRWLDFLSTANEKTEVDMKVLLTQDGGLKVAYDKFREFTRNDEYRQIALAHEKYQRDRLAEMSLARKEGIALGEEKGRAEGRAEGRVEAVADLLRLRFPGTFTSEMESKIRQISDLAKLDQLFAAGVKADNVGDLTKWFR
ncbi:MAG: Rpn family recombination-promoting nuclease/putative transposase [Planctomycetia bacterium]|nr:Rpn family recombination-promoting nuclease/putative transposase [Planctomycetia bacterium]